MHISSSLCNLYGANINNKERLILTVVQNNSLNWPIEENGWGKNREDLTRRKNNSKGTQSSPKYLWVHWGKIYACQAGLNTNSRNRKREKKKHTRIQLHPPFFPSATVFGLLGQMSDIINSVIFQLNRLSDFGASGCTMTLHYWLGPYNSVRTNV